MFKRSVGYIGFMFFISIFLNNCQKSLPYIEDPKTLKNVATSLSRKFCSANDSPIMILRTLLNKTNNNLEYITVDQKSVTNEIPKEIINLNPSHILVHRELIIIQIYGGGPATHRGFCIFLSTQNDKINKIVEQLDLKEVDRNNTIYEYSLYDLRIIVDEWKRL